MYWPKQFSDVPIKVHPELVEIETLFNSGHYEQALETSQASLARYPDAVMPHVIRASVFINREQFEEAEAEIKLGLVKRPDRSALWALAGVAARGQANYQQAVESLQHAVSLANSADEKSSYLFHLAYSYGS